MNKKLPRWVVPAVAGVLCVTVIGALALAIYFSSQPKPAEDAVGLKNPVNIMEPEAVTAEDLEKENEAKEEAPEGAFDTMEMNIQRRLSAGQFDELDSELRELNNKYRNTQDQHEMVFLTRIEDLRSDLAMMTGIDAENGETLLQTFYTPDGLAAAMLYLPLSVKYSAYMNLGALVVPEIEDADALTVNLHQMERSEKDDALEFDIEERWEMDIVDLRRYAANVHGQDLEIVVLQDADTGYWRTYTIESANGEQGILSTFAQVKKRAEQMEVSGHENQLDDVYTYLGEDDVWHPDENMIRPDNTFEDMPDIEGPDPVWPTHEDESDLPWWDAEGRALSENDA